MLLILFHSHSFNHCSTLFSRFLKFVLTQHKSRLILSSDASHLCSWRINRRTCWIRTHNVCKPVSRLWHHRLWRSSKWARKQRSSVCALESVPHFAKDFLNSQKVTSFKRTNHRCTRAFFSLVWMLSSTTTRGHHRPVACPLLRKLHQSNY